MENGEWRILKAEIYYFLARFINANLQRSNKNRAKLNTVHLIYGWSFIILDGIELISKTIIPLDEYVVFEHEIRFHTFLGYRGYPIFIEYTIKG